MKKFISLLLLLICMTSSNLSHAQLNVNIQQLTEVRADVITYVSELNEVRKDFRGQDWDMSSDLNSRLELAAAYTSNFANVAYLYQVGDEQFKKENRNFVELVRKEYLTNVDYLMRTTLLIQRHNKNASINLYCEKLKTNLKKAKSNVEAMRL